MLKLFRLGERKNIEHGGPHAYPGYRDEGIGHLHCRKLRHLKTRVTVLECVVSPSSMGLNSPPTSLPACGCCSTADHPWTSEHPGHFRVSAACCERVSSCQAESPCVCFSRAAWRHRRTSWARRFTQRGGLEEVRVSVPSSVPESF